MATRCRGDDDLEPSAKVLAMIEQLQIAENAGDKMTVCPRLHAPYLLEVFDTGFVGDDVGVVRDPEFGVRREGAEGDARRGARRVPQDGWARGDSDQHQLWRRRVELHDRQSPHQVCGDLHFIATF